MWAEGRFVVAGPQYPVAIQWPTNVARIIHLNPAEHRAFYNSQRFTLNITRSPMARVGYSPSVRLFEAAACGIPIISDDWPGLATFFKPNEEILIAKTAAEVLTILQELPAREADRIGVRARQRALAEHTSAHRAAELESFIRCASRTSPPARDLASVAIGREEVIS
jgi:spore maturation protein CgeB